MAASIDPVAIDQACADLVKEAPVLPMSKIGKCKSHNHHQGSDKFALVHPSVQWEAALKHAEKIGLGSSKYELIHVG
jgi:uncharacterized Fe-S center protein